MPKQHIKNIIFKFPKKRKELPPEYKKIYTEHYLVNREGKSAATSYSKKLESWLHKKIAKDVVGRDFKKTTLEIGAGTLNQLSFEPCNKSYDIVEPFKELYEGSVELKNIRSIYSDISAIKGVAYDRITSVAVFEHIVDLPSVVAHAALLLNDGGCLRTAIPSEGTPLWKLGTKITGYEFNKKYNLDYEVLMDYEHVNTAEEIEYVLNYFFEQSEARNFGINKSLSIYQFFVHKNPKITLAKEYLSSRYDVGGI